MVLTLLKFEQGGRQLEGTSKKITAVHCATCQCNWSEKAFNPACLECGGGALSLPCPICSGRCGAVWLRAVLDSNDCGVAHWLGHCQTTTERQVSQKATMSVEVWVDEAALPEQLVCQLIIFADGTAAVSDCDDQGHLFPHRSGAIRWLSQEGYLPLAEIEPGQVQS